MSQKLASSLVTSFPGTTPVTSRISLARVFCTDTDCAGKMLLTVDAMVSEARLLSDLSDCAQQRHSHRHDNMSIRVDPNAVSLFRHVDWKLTAKLSSKARGATRLANQVIYACRHCGDQAVSKPIKTLAFTRHLTSVPVSITQEAIKVNDLSRYEVSCFS